MENADVGMWHALLEWWRAHSGRMENGENFFSSTGKEWRMRKVLV